MRVSVAEARNTLPKLLYEAEEEEIIVTRRGKPTAVIIPFKVYQRIQRIEGYLTLMKLSEELKDIGVTATQAFEASRKELERRP
jgi:prevent-host-death family protein